ncbi:hypothetical protein [Shewanella aestuarii]|uniref:Uncharacterized protein n=1 Tax=Shewanella aestuarii TaxID=1028752 RepID=A0A6G9QR82_9GAMM|nr:hypothetical protein [Shewanella aestuarii]QIR16565.1 hypothetical protein HBH39_19005 [Shewanella aestuarii]
MSVDGTAIALRRFRILTYLDARIEKGWTDKNITPLLKQLPAEFELESHVNWRTVCRWRQAFLDGNSHISALVPAPGKGRHTTRTTNDSALLEPTIKIMLRQSNPNVAAFYRDYLVEVEAFNELACTQEDRIEQVSYRTFSARYAKMKAEHDAKMKRIESFKPRNRLDLKEAYT